VVLGKPAVIAGKGSTLRVPKQVDPPDRAKARAAWSGEVKSRARHNRHGTSSAQCQHLGPADIRQIV
jgi:hypothetical protein